MPPKQKNEPPKKKASAKKAPPPKAPARKEAPPSPPKYTKDMPVKDMIIEMEIELSPQKMHGSSTRHRPEVKEKILKTYELDNGARQLQVLLQKDEVKKNSLVVAQFQSSLESMRTERDEILAIRDDLLYPWERFFRIMVQHKMKTGSVCFGKKHPAGMSSWIGKQKKRYANIDTVRAFDKPAALDDCSLLKRIGFDFKQTKPYLTMDERFQELVAYKEEHGNLEIPRLTTQGNNLGEWVAKIRKEYDRIQPGEISSNLTPARIQAMSDLGFIWKVRFGRPKKGDPQYRLRRKNKEDEDGTATASPEENRGANNDGDDDNNDGAATTMTAAAVS
jgi:hypothetical protein